MLGAASDCCARVAARLYMLIAVMFALLLAVVSSSVVVYALVGVHFLVVYESAHLESGSSCARPAPRAPTNVRVGARVYVLSCMCEYTCVCVCVCEFVFVCVVRAWCVVCVYVYVCVWIACVYFVFWSSRAVACWRVVLHTLFCIWSYLAFFSRCAFVLGVAAFVRFDWCGFPSRPWFCVGCSCMVVRVRLLFRNFCRAHACLLVA